MKTTPIRIGKPGFVSYLLVLSSGAILIFLMVHSYRRAMNAHAVQSDVQLRTDYSEKEDAVLRAIVAITPNRAIRTMQDGSNESDSSRNPLRWQNIFTESLQLANAATSIPSELVDDLELEDHLVANVGDSQLSVPSRIFKALAGETGYVSQGINRSLGDGYPAPLTVADNQTLIDDPLYPLIADIKKYDSLAEDFLNDADLNGDGVYSYGVGTDFFADEDPRSRFNRIKYPNINFGYAKPGEPFVAKRNWWAFSMDMSSHDSDRTFLSKPRREFVLSIYEIPSQLAISADSFVALGNLDSGEAWQNIDIQGNVFASKARVEGASLPSLASRRGMEFFGNAEIGGKSIGSKPFAPGYRESFEVDNDGAALPVSLSSESGRTAFIPINRGADFFDRFANPIVSPANQVLSKNRWNQYSIGAHQCAMQLDIIAVNDPVSRKPIALRFSYMQGGVRQSFIEPLSSEYSGPLPPGYASIAVDGASMHDFGTDLVDVAYGEGNTFYYKKNRTGEVFFNDAYFGAPSGGSRSGFSRPTSGGVSITPYEVRTLASGQKCVAIYPQRFAAFLNMLGADDTAINHSIAVNVDYTTTGIDNVALVPSIPCTDADYGLIIEECKDLSSFSGGFSVVTNLRTFIGSDFNVVAVTPPSGYPPAGYSPVGDFYPPVSIFCPDIRYGVDTDPFDIRIDGQVGSLANEVNNEPVRPIDSTKMSGKELDASDITMNLRPINHPAELPPITMMNWLVVLEEVRREFIDVD